MLKEYLSNLANAFRTVLGTTDKINAQSFPDKVAEVYEAGEQVGNKEVWAAIQNNGEPANYNSAFCYNRFDDNTYNPHFDIKSKLVNTGTMNTFYANDLITDTKVTIYAGLNLSTCFYGCTNLRTIRKIILQTNNMSSNCFSNAFYGCSSLENIVFEGEIRYSISFAQSPLTKESIISIVNALSSTTTGLTATFNKTAVNTAFETSEGAADGSTSEEWLNLIATKSNWTITLV